MPTNSIWKLFLGSRKLERNDFKDGDKNTGYFYCFANHRRRCNYVEELLFNCGCITGNSMREAAKDFFQDLYEEKFARRPRLDDLQFKRMDEAVS